MLRFGMTIVVQVLIGKKFTLEGDNFQWYLNVLLADNSVKNPHLSLDLYFPLPMMG